MGDSVDNVPGVTGVGPKTASKLIKEHGDLEAVLAAAQTPEFKKGKLSDNLIEQADAARLAAQLVDAESATTRCPSRSTSWRCRAFPTRRCAPSSSITASSRC